MVNLSVFGQNYNSPKNIATLFEVIRDDTKSKFNVNIADSFRIKILPGIMTYVWKTFANNIWSSNSHLPFSEKLMMLNKHVCREAIAYIEDQLSPKQQDDMPSQQPPQHIPQQAPPRPRPSGPPASHTTTPQTYEQQLADRNMTYAGQPQTQAPPQLPSERDADKPISNDEMEKRIRDLASMRQNDKEAHIIPSAGHDDAEIIPEVIPSQNQTRGEQPQQQRDPRDIAKRLSQQYLSQTQHHHIPPPPQYHHTPPPSHHHVITPPTPQSAASSSQHHVVTPPQKQRERDDMILRIAYDTQNSVPQHVFTSSPSGHIEHISSQKAQSNILKRVSTSAIISKVIIHRFRVTNTNWNIHCRNNVVYLKESPAADPISIIITPGSYETKEKFIDAVNDSICEQYGDVICITDIPDGDDTAVINVTSDIKDFASELLSDITISGFSKYFKTDEEFDDDLEYVSFFGDKMRIPLRRSLSPVYDKESFEICPYIWTQDDGTVRLIWNGPWTFENGMDIRLFHSDGSLCKECPKNIRIVFDVYWKFDL